MDSNMAVNAVINEVKKAVIGKDAVIAKVLLAIIAGGHILLDDIPGVGKTTIALAFSKVLSLDYNRVQFTPDVLPTDITGFSIYDRDKNEFFFKKGSAFCNLFLADEINRTSSKTQSALLQLMEEGKITADGKTYDLEKPYTVIATQNPVGSIGTHMLPESQLDRFMVMLTIGYPDYESEVSILKSKHQNNPLDNIRQIFTKRDLVELQNISENVYIADEVYEYIAKLSQKTRNNPLIKLGISPRGAISVTKMAKAVACANRRSYVTPDDVVYIFADTVKHRIILNPSAKVAGNNIDNILKDIIRSVPVPVLENVKNG